MSVIDNFSKNIQYNLKNYENKKFHEKFSDPEIHMEESS